MDFSDILWYNYTYATSITYAWSVNKVIGYGGMKHDKTNGRLPWRDN